MALEQGFPSALGEIWDSKLINPWVDRKFARVLCNEFYNLFWFSFPMFLTNTPFLPTPKRATFIFPFFSILAVMSP